MSPLTLSRDGLEFVATINPAQIKRAFSFEFGKTKPVGAKAGTERLGGAGKETFGFALVIDGTGVVQPRDGALAKVEDQLDRLRDVLCEADAPVPCVKLLWGPLVRLLRLEKMEVTHTLFAPDGVPLRARVDLSLYGPLPPDSEAAPAAPTGGGEAALVETRDGDTLQKLSRDHYGDAVDPADLARANDLPSLRDPLPPGTVLVLPALADAV